jgi:hypothetical protein
MKCKAFSWYFFENFAKKKTLLWARVLFWTLDIVPKTMDNVQNSRANCNTPFGQDHSTHHCQKSLDFSNPLSGRITEASPTTDHVPRPLLSTYNPHHLLPYRPTTSITSFWPSKWFLLKTVYVFPVSLFEI